MKRLVVTAALLGLLFAAAASAGKSDSRVEIVNRSDWDIHRLYLSPVDDEEWGPDQLGDHIIASGERFTLQGIPCDDYDVQLIDEDGDACVVGGVSLCGERDRWVISNSDLLSCQAATE